MAALEPCDGEISADTADKVVKAKVALENFYNNLLAQHTDRKNRWAKYFVHAASDLLSLSPNPLL